MWSGAGSEQMRQVEKQGCFSGGRSPCHPAGERIQGCCVGPAQEEPLQEVHMGTWSPSS